jgi:replication factor A1
VKRLVIYTVNDLDDRRAGVSIRLRILSESEPRTVKTKDGQEHSVVDVMVGDRTGTVPLSLWDERIHDVDIGDIIDVENAYVSSFKGRLRLNIGKYGTIEKVQDEGFPSADELSKLRRRTYRRRRTGYAGQV